MLATFGLSLSLFCGVSGILLLARPRWFMEAAKRMDKAYSTEKIREQLETGTDNLRELLDRNIDLSAKLLRFYRLIGLVALVVGILLVVTFVISPSAV